MTPAGPSKETLTGLAFVAVLLALIFAPTLRDPPEALAIGAVGLLFVGAFLIGRRLVLSYRWTRPVRLLDDPVPPHWAEIVRASFPLARELEPPEFERLLKLVQLFLDEKNVEGAGGLELTEEMRVLIAAQACFLVLRMEVGLYPGLRSVVVYPGAMRPKIVGAATGGIGISSDERPTPVLGQSWRHGVVVLSWDSARQGAFDPRDGRNVVFHEFAHQLDQETGEADGTPVGVPLSSLKPWAEVLERRFGILKKATRRGSRTVMDSYGATNKAEFFAVATETFFEKPRKLREKQPDLYHRLTEFFRMDPAEGYEAPADDGTKLARGRTRAHLGRHRPRTSR